MFLIRAADEHWPADLDRTFAAHHNLGDAVLALDSIHADHEQQCAAAGELPTQLSLVLLDDRGGWYGSHFATGPAAALTFASHMRRRL